MLDTCQQRGVPLIIGYQSGIAGLSDPMAHFQYQELGKVGAIPSGTRMLLLPSLGQITRQWSPHMSRLLSQHTAASVIASDDHLQLILWQAERRAPFDVSPITIDWQPWPRDDQPQIGPNLFPQFDRQIEKWQFTGELAQQAGKSVAWKTLPDWSRIDGIGQQAHDLLQQQDRIPLPSRVLYDSLRQPVPMPKDGLEHGSGWGLHPHRQPFVEALSFLQNNGPREVVDQNNQDLTDAAAADGVDLAEDATGLLAPTDPGFIRSLQHLSLLPVDGLRAALVNQAVLDRVYDRWQVDPGLMVRLLALRPMELWRWAAQQDQIDPLLHRAIVFQGLRSGQTADKAWRALVIRCRDAEALRSVIDASLRENGSSLARLLFDRWEYATDFDQPLDSDSLLQHRLAVAIFDSPLLSPTPLRQLALAVEARSELKGPARRVIQRFFDRHGRERRLPVNPLLSDQP